MLSDPSGARRGCRRLQAWGAVCLLLAACGTGEADRAVARRWLLCEECQHGELAAVVARKDRMVPLLAGAIRGLSPGQRANLRRQLQETYRQLAIRAFDEHRVLPLSADDYIAHFTSNYEAVYQSRAVAGLAAIGTSAARQALQRAADAVGSGALIVRGDVIDQLTTATGSPVPGGPVSWVSIAAGAFRTCGIRSDGKAYCWGRNDVGQLGDGTVDPRPTPTLVAGHLTFSSIAMGSSDGYGGYHTCGVAVDSVYCWGGNARGQLGDSSTTPRNVPTPVAGGIAFSGVAVGDNHTCGWTAAHQAYCWGANDSSQLGDGSLTDRLQPVLSAQGLGVRSIRAGAFHTCADSLDGRLYCWGGNSYGQLGVGDTTTKGPTPAQVTLSWHFTSFSLGAVHGCGVILGGTAAVHGLGFCWGRNDGRLGDGTASQRDSLTAVAGGYRFVTISAGDGHTCGIVVGTRELRCWGDNSHGQLGDSTNTGRLVSVAVAGAMSFATVSAGAGHTCGITTQGNAFCWGLNSDGQLGDGTKTDRSFPTAVITP